MKVAIWISKEKMLPAQEKVLKDVDYNIIIYNNVKEKEKINTDINVCVFNLKRE